MTRNGKITQLGVTLTLLATLGGCAGSGKSVQPAAAPQGAARLAVLSGKVVETMDAAGYTYVLLDTNGKKTWVAAPTMKVTVGQEVQLLPGAEMSQFTSKALNRTFDKIIFSGGVPGGGQAAGEKQSKVVVTKTGEEPILAGKVAETMNSAGYTYLRLEKDGKSSWIAVPVTQVAVGDEVVVQPGTAMGTFVSKSMNRTFESIYFSSGIDPVAGKETKVAADGGSEAAKSPALPSGHPAIAAGTAPKAAPAPAAEPISGKVVETMNGGGYSYLCLEKDGKKTWAAVPAMQVKVGEEMTLAPGSVMSNFTSKSLNRTFDSIVFSNGPVK